MVILTLQGKFPDENMEEDGYVGVAPVDAFPPQNTFGKTSFNKCCPFTFSQVGFQIVPARIVITTRKLKLRKPQLHRGAVA